MHPSREGLCRRGGWPGIEIRSKVTNGSKTGGSARHTDTQRTGRSFPADGYVGYRSSVYRELQGLVEAPVTPMLRPGRTIRTLILPYADRDRPERPYLPRYAHPIPHQPPWVLGDHPLTPPEASAPPLAPTRTDEPALRAI